MGAEYRRQSTNPQTLVMSGSKNVTASFTPISVSTATAITAPTITYGTAASVTASVTSGQGTITGNVSLTVDNGAALTHTLSSRSSVFSINGLAAGSHSLRATFAAQGTFAASSATATLQVNQATATVSISNIPSNAVYGGSFIPNYSYIGDGIVSVTSNTPSTCVVSGSVASLVGVGTCTLTAHATAGTNYAATTGNLRSFAIVHASTTTTVVSSKNPQLVGQPITFSATVSGQFNGVATGSVVFKAGAVSLGSVALTNNQASLTTSFATAGTRSRFATRTLIEFGREPLLLFLKFQLNVGHPSSSCRERR